MVKHVKACEIVSCEKRLISIFQEFFASIIRVLDLWGVGGLVLAIILWAFEILLIFTNFLGS